MSEKNPTPVENKDGEAATVEPQEAPAPFVPGPEAAESEMNSRHDAEVTLAVVSPFWTTSFNFGTEDGGTLSIDRAGTVVPRSILQDVLEAARNSGIALTEVSD